MGTDPRPGLGVLEVGDVVIVMPTGMGDRHSSAAPTRAVIAKRGRVWIDVAPEAGGNLAFYDSRFRMDDQTNGSDNTSRRGRFVTQDQHAWDRRRSAAREYLREAGITVETSVRKRDFDSPDVPGRWCGREMELANLLRATEGLDPL